MNLQLFNDYLSKSDHVQASVRVIEECFTTYGNDPDFFCISFNGGKDCTVLLHLVKMVMLRNNLNFRLKSLRITLPDTFIELDHFVKSSVEKYELEYLEFEGPDFKKALGELKRQEPKMDAILMGTRASDIKYTMKSFQRTDPGWPDFMRVNPILDWSYHDIWDYLIKLRVPYCPLYDIGYTSIGSKKNTVLNPKLLRIKDTGETFYLPASSLQDPLDERHGRNPC